MAQAKRGSSAAGVTIVVILLLVLGSLGYYQYVYCGAPMLSGTSTATGSLSNSTSAASSSAPAPSPCSTSTSTSTSVAPIGKVVMVNITQNAAGACGGASAVQTSDPKTCNAYSPNPITLVANYNNTVVFNNVDTAVHTATANDKSFDTGILQAGQQSATETIPVGTHSYFCAVHPWMKGEIVVVQGTGPVPKTTSSASGGASSSSSTASASGSPTSSTSTTSAPSSGAAAVQVSIPDGTGANLSAAGYSPDSIRVVIGVNNTVTWTNADSVPHTVTAGDKSFDSGNLAPGKSFTYTFTAAGTYNYGCLYHSWMKGTVVVLKG